jgi:hypothetical protein
MYKGERVKGKNEIGTKRSKKSTAKRSIGGNFFGAIFMNLKNTFHPFT